MLKIFTNIFSCKEKPQSQEITRQRLGQPLSMEDGGPPRIYATVLYTLTGFIIGGIIWGSISEIREVANTQGVIMPSEAITGVQHLEGGIVSEILVKDNDRVEKDQPLIRLKPVSASSDLGQLQTRFARFALTGIRLDAERKGEKPKFGETGKKYPELAADQMAKYQANTASMRAEEDLLMARIEQARVDMNSRKANQVALGVQVEIEEEKLRIQKQLLDEGYTSRRIYLDAKSSYHRSRSDFIAAKGQYEMAERRLAEAQSALKKAKADSAGRIAGERAEAAAERAELEDQIIKQEERFNRLFVRAPVAGFVKQIIPQSIGAVLRPGDLVAEIVPAGLELVAEVKIMPGDIGHIKEGATADVKISTYDPNRFGSLKAIVRSISASTFKTEKGEPYYRAVLGLESEFVGKGSLKRQLATGMIVTADIVTGNKSLVRYMFKPIFRSLDMAFSER